MLPNAFSGTFNENAIGIATKTAMNARLEYGGRSDLLFLELFLKKKKEGVLIMVITLHFGSTPLHLALFLMEQFLLH